MGIKMKRKKSTYILCIMYMSICVLCFVYLVFTLYRKMHLGILCNLTDDEASENKEMTKEKKRVHVWHLTTFGLAWPGLASDFRLET